MHGCLPVGKAYHLTTSTGGDRRPHTAPEYPQKVARMPTVGLSTPRPSGKPTLSHADAQAQLHKGMQSIR
eukprot:COSAG02_NODE_6925_length_3284_cov_6.834466_1_plen_69_part_10